MNRDIIFLQAIRLMRTVTVKPNKIKFKSDFSLILLLITTKINY